MNDYQLSKRDLTSQQMEDIVQRGAPIPPQYPLGAPEYISLQLARRNYLLTVTNKYLRFMSGILIGATVLIIAGGTYINHKLNKIGKTIEQTTIKFEQSFAELNTSLTSLKQSYTQLDTSLTTLKETVGYFETSLNKSLDEISKEFKNIEYEVREGLKETEKDLSNVRKDLQGAKGDLESALKDISKQ